MKNFPGQLNIAMLSLHSCPCGKLGSRYTGGMNIYIKNVAAELIRQGHSVVIFTCSHDSAEDGKIEIPDGKINLVHIQAEDFITIPEFRLDGHVSMLASQIVEYSLVNGLHFDIIHSHYWLSGMVGDKLNSMWKIPHITMFHTLGEIKNETGPGKMEPAYRIYREKDIIQSCQMVVASTVKEKRALIEKYGADDEKIAVIPCGVNPRLFRPFNKQIAREICGIGPGNVILFVGRADPIKGLENLLEAVLMLGGRHDCRLVIIGGDDNSMAEVKGMISASGGYGVGHKIHLAGPVRHERMYLYYSAADFCIIPSYYESFSLVALEAISCGIPILSTDVGDVREISRCCSLCRVIANNDPLELARNIDGFFDDIEKHAGDGQYNLSNKYTWENITERIIECYFTLVHDTSLLTREAPIV